MARADDDRKPQAKEETTHAIRGPAGVRIRGFTLKVVKGPEKNRVIVLDGSLPTSVLVGQSPSCEIRLDDREISRRHAALSLVGSRLRVVDQGSKNGTFVNGVNVQEALLVGGETITMGGTQLLAKADAKDSLVSLGEETAFGALLGASPTMKRLYGALTQLARSSVPVVIEGETGTGKEVCAEAIHQRSSRASGPFVVFDCTTVASNLIESALFGHERGAFTGASEARRGVFEQADGGTLLIDEIGDLDRGLQAKLLRALERSEVQRIGSERWNKVDVRILAATRRNLDAEVQAGRFRDDLFFRLMVARVELPPLRERRTDIGVLARAFWAESGATGEIPPETLREWSEADWPGNVRELKNAVARLIALGDTRLSLLPKPTAEATSTDAVARVLALDLPLPVAREAILRDFERRYVTHVLAKNEGNVTRAARAAGVSQRYFQLVRAKMEK